MNWFHANGCTAARIVGGLAVTMLFAVLGGAPSTAFAVTVENRAIRLNGGRADFGSGSHLVGSPNGSGNLRYDYRREFGDGILVASARLTGTLYLDSLDPGEVRIRIRCLNLFGATLTVASEDLAGPGGDANNAANQKTIDLSCPADPDLHDVRIEVGTVIFGRFLLTESTKAAAPAIRDSFLSINSGTADFGSGLHAGGFPLGKAEVEFDRQNGELTAFVNGILYWDALLSAGTARVVIDFMDDDGDVLGSVTRNVSGPGGNANDPKNQRVIQERFDQFGQPCFKVRLKVGTVVGGSMVNVTTKTISFASLGEFEITPSEQTVEIYDRLNYAFTWTVPEPLSWRDLASLQFRIREGDATVLSIYFDEASGDFTVTSDTGISARSHGRRRRLQSSAARFHVGRASVVASGPTSPTVTLNLPVSFKRSAAGHTYVVEVAASDDPGNHEGFVEVGTVTVTR